MPGGFGTVMGGLGFDDDSGGFGLEDDSGGVGTVIGGFGLEEDVSGGFGIEFGIEVESGGFGFEFEFGLADDSGGLGTMIGPGGGLSSGYEDGGGFRGVFGGLTQKGGALSGTESGASGT